MQTEIFGLTTEYEIAGEGSPVLVLHGWGCNIKAISPVARCLNGLGYKTVSLDFPGFGGTEEPKEPWGVGEYARFTREFIKKMGLEGASVACHSFGGRVTIMLAAAEPKLFDKLIMIDPAGVRQKRGIKYYARTYGYKALKQLAKIPFIDKLTGFSEKRQNAGSADYRALKSDVMRKTFVNVVNLDLKKSLKSVTNDALLIWGENDKDINRWQMGVMEKNMPNAGLAVIKNAGHFAYIDNYAQFSAVLQAYMKRQGV